MILRLYSDSRATGQSSDLPDVASCWLYRENFIVVDDEDKTRNQYMAEFGEQVLVFSKADIASRFDEADNFCDRRSIFTPVMPVSTGKTGRV